MHNSLRQTPTYAFNMSNFQTNKYSSMMHQFYFYHFPFSFELETHCDRKICLNYSQATARNGFVCLQSSTAPRKVWVISMRLKRVIRSHYERWKKAGEISGLDGTWAANQFVCLRSLQHNLLNECALKEWRLSVISRGEMINNWLISAGKVKHKFH